jgi:flagellar basal body-associated protein FliL
VEEGNKKIFSYYSLIGLIAVLSIILYIFPEWKIFPSFWNFPSALMAFCAPCALLLFIYGRDFLRFIPKAFVAIFVRMENPDDLMAAIACSGSRCAVGVGMIGTLINIINNFLIMDNPSKFGIGLVNSFLCLLYSLIFSEFFFVPLYRIFSGISAKAREFKKEHLYIAGFVVLAYFLTYYLILNIFLVASTRSQPKKSTYISDPSTKFTMKGHVQLPLIQTNLACSETAVVKLKIAFYLTDPDIDFYFKNKSENNPDGMLREMKAGIIDIIRKKTPEALLAGNAKSAIRDEVMSMLNDMLKKKNINEKVNLININEFLIDCN